MKTYSAHNQRFTHPPIYFRGIVCLFAALMLTVVDMKGDTSYSVNANISAVLSNGTLTITGTGAIPDYSSTNDIPWYNERNDITTLIIGNNITKIGKSSFYDCSKISRIILPATLSSIGPGAFYKCYIIKEVHFAGTPSQWASINFETTDQNRNSHPFYANVNKSPSSGTTTREFFFHGNSSASKVIVLTPGITEVKPYAFYGATGINGINIPGSVNVIGTNAFNISSYGSATDKWIAINRKTAPSSVGTSAFKAGITLYVPIGSTGYGDTWNSLTVDNTSEINGTCGASTTTDVQWILSEDGVLSFTGHGVMNVGTRGDGLPWARFRRLVHKVEISSDETGDITNIAHAISWNWAMTEVSINQNTIPSLNSTSENINSNYNTADKIKLLIKANESLINSAKTTSVWNNTKFQLGLNEPVVLADNTDNGELLGAVKEYVELPFEVEFGRTLTNAQYNTFCSPVPMNAEQITAVFGGADIRALESTSYDEETKELTLNFSESSLTEIEAGKPYLIKPVNETEDPRLANITPGDIKTTPTDATTEFVDFKGVLAPTALTGGNKNTLFLGADNELFWPESTGNLNGFRAYFKIKGAAAQAAKRARISMGGKIATGIENPSPALPSREGVKILRDGKLYLMYKGQMYDVQGRRI